MHSITDRLHSTHSAFVFCTTILSRQHCNTNVSLALNQQLMNGIAFYLTALREASHYQKCGIFGVAVNGPCCVLYPKSAMEIYFRFRTTPPPSFCINSKTCTFGNEGLPSVRSPFFTEYFACYHICVLFHHQVLSQFCLNHQCTAMHINADQGL